MGEDGECAFGVFAVLVEGGVDFTVVDRGFWRFEIFAESVGEFAEVVFVAGDDVFGTCGNVAVVEFCLFNIEVCFFDVDYELREGIMKCLLGVVEFLSGL